jgi:hypothetical protein
MSSTDEPVVVGDISTAAATITGRAGGDPVEAAGRARKLSLMAYCQEHKGVFLR